MYKNNVAALKLGSKVSSWFSVELVQKQVCVQFLFILVALMDFVLTKTVKAIEENCIKWKGKTLLELIILMI